MSSVDDAVAAIHAGEPVVLPTDTVYGLACTPYREAPVRRLSELKGRRPGSRPVALVAASVDWLLECVPELRGRDGMVARALLPGPLTLVLSNPARRFPWLTGARGDTIGVRVPELTGAAREVLERVGAVAATSANLHGQPDPRRVDEIVSQIVRAVAVVVDGGELPGVPSTVLDLTSGAPRVLRDGAVAAPDALARVAVALGE